MIDPADKFIAGTDYTGCLDATSGAGQLDFQRPGPYLVRATYADGHSDHFEVYIVSQPSDVVLPKSACGTGGFVEMPVTSGAQGYRGTPFASDPNGYSTQGTLNGLISQIKSDYGNAGTQIDVALRYHGAPGQFTIQDGETVSETGAKGKANFDKLCQALRGRVKSVTLLSCRTGMGTKGCQFIKALSACTGATVNATCGKVTTVWKKNNPSGTVKFVTNGAQGNSTSCP